MVRRFGGVSLRRVVRRVVLAVLVLFLLLCVLASDAEAATPDQPLERGDFAGSFGIGQGRSMYLECYGKGSPTVILDGGLREAAGVWSSRSAETPAGLTVLGGVARFTRVCAYDRPGTLLTETEFSRGSPVRMPRTAASEVADLHSLLKLAGISAPFVFVAHSWGGLIDRLYAATYPRQVAGMVLVDALAEYIQGPLDPAQMTAYSALNDAPIEGLDYPDLERVLFGPSFAQMRRAERRRPLGHIPLSVISKGLPFQVPDVLPAGLSRAAIERAWQIAQDKLAKLAPNAVHVIAKHSSHNVMITQPRLIIDQTCRVVHAVRRAHGLR